MHLVTTVQKKTLVGKNFGEFGESQQFANFFANFPVFVT